MGKRDVLLLVVVLAIGVTFVASLLPPDPPQSWQAQASASNSSRPATSSDSATHPAYLVSAWQTDPSFAATLDAVNATFRASWQESEVPVSTAADDLTLARRASLALTGTIPSLEEIRMFEARPAGGRLEWWIDGLLADRRSSEYLAERLARAWVGVDVGPFLIYRRGRFVAWLADELEKNTPYDQLVRQIVASDGLWTSRPATNFITSAIPPGTENRGPDEAKLAGRVARSLLGLRIDCAECHDHPFDVWTETQFHELAAFFGQTEHSFTGVREGKHVYKHQDPVSGEEETYEPAVPFQEELLPQRGNRRQKLAGWLTHPDNQALAPAAVNRMWALLFGHPLVEGVDDMPPPEEHPPVLKLLADDFRTHDFDLRRLIHLMSSTVAFQRSSLEPEGLTDDEHELALSEWALFPVTRLRGEQVIGSILQGCSIQTIDHESNILVRIARATGQADFLKRYGDAGQDELLAESSTIPQRLLLLNGNIVTKQTRDNLLTNAASQIAVLAPDDNAAIEAAYLALLTRRPTTEESIHFLARLNETRGKRRMAVIEDLYVALINTTEFSWNH